MSFSILTVAPPASVPSQVYTAFNSTQNNASVEGQFLNLCLINQTNSSLEYRKVQYGIGRISLTNNTTQTALTVNVPVVISNAGIALDTLSVNFDSVSAGVLRFTGSDIPNRCLVRASINIYATVNNQQINFVLLRNGVATNIQGISTASNGIQTAQQCVLDGIFNCSTNDTFSIQMTNATASNPVIVANFSIIASTNFS